MGMAGIKVNIVAGERKQVIATLRARQPPAEPDQLDARLSRPAY